MLCIAVLCWCMIKITNFSIIWQTSICQQNILNMLLHDVIFFTVWRISVITQTKCITVLLISTCQTYVHKHTHAAFIQLPSFHELLLSGPAFNWQAGRSTMLWHSSQLKVLMPTITHLPQHFLIYHLTSAGRNASIAFTSALRHKDITSNIAQDHDKHSPGCSCSQDVSVNVYNIYSTCCYTTLYSLLCDGLV